jgi:lipid-A-disaccharide synthase
MTDPTSESPLIFLLAGEASGDNLGADLMKEIKGILGADVRFAGVGGPLMMAQGLAPLFPMEELSVMGFFEILPKIFHFRRRIQETIQSIGILKPDMVVTIDSPGFNVRVLKGVQSFENRPQLVHYVAPSVWAWRPKRAKKIAQLVDHLLTLLPFEPPYFEKEGLPSTFVGHPITKDKPINKKKETSEQTLLLLPGSRFSELKYMAPIFADTLHLVLQDFPNLNIVIPTFPHLQPVLESTFKSISLPIRYVLDGDAKRQAFEESDVALATSGTVALELAAFQVPCVIAYKTSWLTYQIAKRLVKVKYISLPNILMDKSIIREYIQDKCEAIFLKKAVADLLTDKNQNQVMKKISSKLWPKWGLKQKQKTYKFLLGVPKKLTGMSVLLLMP